MKEIRYQEKYIKKVAEQSIEFLEDKYRDDSVIIFQAPTGSGKTYMVSQALTQIAKLGKVSYSFIWVSVNSLHEQSRISLARYLENERLLECITINEIQNKTIEQNEIVFINWDSLIKENNVFRMENESDWNLQNVISNTKDEGREIILIIDESHRTAKAEKALEVIKEISPKLVLEVTATPTLSLAGTLIRIPLAEVIAEGMIKREVHINHGAHNITENKDLLEIALKKRKQIKSLYNDLGIEINPLLLIQIPNKKTTDTIPPEDYIMGLLADQDITTANNNLAIWLSETKINKELVELNNSPVDVLIFKEAIALGWDCPRAAILFLQREWKQDRYTFNIQTLGRIMRMPQQKHYDEKPELNIGYVYSASDNFEIVQELASDYVSSLQMERDENIYNKPVKLVSEFIRRQRELTRLSGDFKKCLFDAAIELETKDNINANIKEITKSFAVSGKFSALDQEQSIVFDKQIKIKKDSKEIDDSYREFCGQLASPYSKARSSQIIKSSIRSWFKEQYNIGDEDQIALAVMHGNNNSTIKQLVEEAKEKYKTLPIRKEEIIATPDWEVPLNVSIFTDYAKVENSNKSILKQPNDKKLFAKKLRNGKIDLSNPEATFINELDKTDDDIQWWFKNAHGESKYFGIAYKKQRGQLYGFYPDFLIKTKKETLIVEIKDDKDFKPENLLKLRAGQAYVANNLQKEPVKFYILAPDDYFSFFKLLREQNLEKFKSSFEENLIRYNKSQQQVTNDKTEKTDKDKENLELWDELDKITNERNDLQLKNDMLTLSLEQAEENIKIIVQSNFIPTPNNILETNVSIPFNICVLGEVSDETLIIQELQKYFTKLKVATTDWDIKFFNNIKMQNADVLRSLVKGQSRYNLIITGQIFHHSGKGNKKANIISELKNDKYITHKVGVTPTDQLTPDKLLKVLDEYLTKDSLHI